MTKNSYTIGDICSLTGVNRITVSRWIDAGKLRALKDNRGKYYIRGEDFEEFVAANPKYQKWVRRDEDQAFVNFCKEMLVNLYSMNSKILGEGHESIWNDGYEMALKEMEIKLKNKIAEHDMSADCKSKWNDGYETAIKEMELMLKNKIIEHDMPAGCKSRHYSKTRG